MRSRAHLTPSWRERWGWLVVFAAAVMVALAVGVVGAQRLTADEPLELGAPSSRP